MKVSEIKEKLGLTLYGGETGLEREVTAGYTSDLLSDVMGHAGAGSLWVTLQTHKNVIAIASLKELPAVILVRGFRPEADMLDHAREEGIAVLGTTDGTFEITGKLYSLLNIQ
jgi:serine kinase of HPr protein (carbohydrate metabolism regulator)